MKFWRRRSTITRGYLWQQRQHLILTGTSTFAELTESRPGIAPWCTDNRIVPKFEDRLAQLTFAAKCTCYIVRKRGTNAGNGTAFFVGPNTLLTAGHVAHKKGDKIIAQLPGTQEVATVERVIEGDPNLATFECVVKKTLYREGSSEPDITLLDCSKSFSATAWLSIERTYLEPDTAIDMLGYPGAYGREYLRQKQKYEVSIADEGDVKRLLPSWKLVVSHGPVLQPGDRYKVSTIGGMSGGPVILNGKAVGSYPCQDN
jgi:hypothetical protein